MRHSSFAYALLLLALTAPVAAQTITSAKAPPKAAADTLPPAAVPVPQIPTRAAATEARLDEIWQTLPPTRARARVAADYAAARDTISTVLELQKRQGQEHATKRSLTDLHNEWSRRLEQMRGWQEGIANRTDGMAVIQTELIRRDTTWRLTRAEATKANAPPDVTELVDNILQRNRVLQDTVEARIVELVRLQSQITRTIGLLQQVDDQTTEQLASMRRDLFSLDAPPLWKALTRADTTRDLRPDVRAGAAQTRRELTYFHEAYRVPIYVHLASTLALLFAVS